MMDAETAAAVHPAHPTQPDGVSMEEPDQTDMPPERQKKFRIAVYVIIVLALIAVGMSAYQVIRSAQDEEMHPPPEVEGPQPLLPPQE